MASLKFWLGLAVVVVILIVLVIHRSKARNASIGLPLGLGSVTFDLTPNDRVVAWKMHVQLVTRKAALPFDEQFDIVAEVFDSLYELFRVARELLLEAPPTYRKGQGGVAELVIRVLNDGVRPVLTKWQGEYRRWWDGALQDPRNALRSPQEIQRDYPKFVEVVRDLKMLNAEMSKFADDLALIAAGRAARTRKSVKIRPAAPMNTGEIEG